MDIEERIFDDCSDIDESTKESKNEEPPTKKRVFDISDIRFVPFKRKPKVIPKPKPKVTPKRKAKETKKKGKKQQRR